MTDEQKSATKVYSAMCQTLTEKGWNFERNDEKLLVKFSCGGDDLSMPFIVQIDADRQLARVISQIPFDFDEKHRLQGALAASRINYKLAMGSFDYNYETGSMLFVLNTTFKGSIISGETIFQMITCAAATVDDYNDKLLMVAKDMLPPEKVAD